MILDKLKKLGIALTIGLSVTSCELFSTKETSDYCLRYELVALTTDQGNILPEDKFLIIDRNDADYAKLCLGEDF